MGPNHWGLRDEEITGHSSLLSTEIFSTSVSPMRLIIVSVVSLSNGSAAGPLGCYELNKSWDTGSFVGWIQFHNSTTADLDVNFHIPTRNQSTETFEDFIFSYKGMDYVFEDGIVLYGDILTRPLAGLDEFVDKMEGDELLLPLKFPYNATDDTLRLRATFYSGVFMDYMFPEVMHKVACPEIPTPLTNQTSISIPYNLRFP
jgi:hypothetical protein